MYWLLEMHKVVGSRENTIGKLGGDMQSFMGFEIGEIAPGHLSGLLPWNQAFNDKCNILFFFKLKDGQGQKH